MHTSYDYEIYGLSDVGNTREKNEDIYRAIHEHNLFSIADGMGGHKAGEVAAKEAVNHVCNLLIKQFSINKEILSLEKIIYHINLAIKEANHRVYSLSKTHENLNGMGTTLCCLHFFANTAVFAHVGDSRIYHFTNNSLIQLTKDHSLINKLKSNKILNHPLSYKNIITKAVGTTKKIEPTINTTYFNAGDMFLMATDGLTDYVPQDIMKKIFETHISPKNISENLIKEAKKNNSNDNITALVIKIKNRNV